MELYLGLGLLHVAFYCTEKHAYTESTYQGRFGCATIAHILNSYDAAESSLAHHPHV